jgi:hypothetical protein
MGWEIAGRHRELAKPQTYRRGTGDTWHEIEVTLLEATDDYIHVKTSIHDGSLVWALKPISSSFLIYRDGRIEIWLSLEEAWPARRARCTRRLT